MFDIPLDEEFFNSDEKPLFNELTYEENMLLQLKLHGVAWEIMLVHGPTYIATWEMEIAQLCNDLQDVFKVKVDYV